MKNISHGFNPFQIFLSEYFAKSPFFYLYVYYNENKCLEQYVKTLHDRTS